MQKRGYADLPLHGGRVPQWLADRMTTLGGAVAEAVLYHYGPSELLTRLSDPYWFQALGCVLGMDWHSSGITTSVLGALKRALNPRADELGIWVCGGRGRHSRRTPDELRMIGEKTGLNAEDLVATSRLAAKIDNNALQDGFQLYLHTFILSREGEWAIVQQGMNDRSGLARRYHWASADLRCFTSEPHAAIVGENQGTILNLVHRQADRAQQALLALAREHPEKVLHEARSITLPRRHRVKSSDVDLKRLGAVLALAHERSLKSFADFLLLDGLGPRTLQALALVAEVVHGTPVRFADPARFSFAHGGKDGHPFPVPTKTYDETIDVMRRALNSAKVGHSEKLDGLSRLHRFQQEIERRMSPAADFEQAVQKELRESAALKGRSVVSAAARKTGGVRQLKLFD